MRLLKRIIIIISIVCCSFIAKGQTYKYRFTDFISNSKKEYLMERTVIGDSVLSEYFYAYEDSNSYKEYIFRKEKSLFINGITELKNGSTQLNYETIDNSLFFKRFVNVYVKSENLDTLINNIRYTYNIYEIYYSKLGDVDTDDLRLYVDIEKGIIIKREYFIEKTVYHREELIE
jgi:hypothetical protein